MSIKERLLTFYFANKGGINGASIGATLAILIMVINIYRTIIIVIFASIGYYIGKRLSTDKDFIKKILDKFLPPGTYR